MKKGVLITSKIILLLALLNVYSFSVRHVSIGGEKLGFLTDPLQNFIEFPLIVKSVFTEFENPEPYHVYADTGFKEINHLDYDLFALNAHVDQQGNSYLYELKNLKNNDVLHTWEFSIDNFEGDSKLFPVAHPQNPILLEDSSLIGMLYETKNLFRLDSESNLVWSNHSIKFHHSINLSGDYLWACGWEDAYTWNEHSNNSTSFRDDLLVKIDINSGEILYKKSLASVLIENNRIDLVHGAANDETDEGLEVFHINDIQPILSDGTYWKKGDLLISLRNRSSIILYRPENNEILRVISGPFLLQHDVDILSPHEISVFNNNRTSTYTSIDHQTDTPPKSILKSSNVVVYDLESDEFSTPFLDVFQRENVYSPRQGLHEFLSNGDLFIESTEQGKIFIIRNDDIIFQQYPNRINEKGTTEYPHWMRIYEDLEFLN